MLNILYDVSNTNNPELGNISVNIYNKIDKYLNISWQLFFVYVIIKKSFCLNYFLSNL